MFRPEFLYLWTKQNKATLVFQGASNTSLCRFESFVDSCAATHVMTIFLIGSRIEITLTDLQSLSSAQCLVKSAQHPRRWSNRDPNKFQERRDAHRASRCRCNTIKAFRATFWLRSSFCRGFQVGEGSGCLNGSGESVSLETARGAFASSVSEFHSLFVTILCRVSDVHVRGKYR